MPKLRLWLRVGLVAALTCALGAVFAGPAGAYTQAQKHRIQRHLLRTLKKHPKVVLSHKFYVQASHVDFTLPLTIRLNPCVATENGVLTPGATCQGFNASNDQLALDLGPSVGVKTVNLSGRILANAKFLDPFQGQGEPGELSLSIPSYSAGSAGGATPNARLRTTPVQVLTNPDIAGTCDNTFFGTTNDPDSSNNNPGGIDPTSVFRTSFLPVGVAGTGAASGGEAFLFGNPAGNNVNDNVKVTLNTVIPVNSILRDVNPGVGDPNNCRQTWSGKVDNTVTAIASGQLRITPAFTLDSKLRLAKVTLTGPVVHNEIDACLDPYAPYKTATLPGPTVVAGDPTTAPTANCGTFPNPLSAPPSNPTTVKLNTDVTVTSITGEALVGDIPDQLPPTPATGAGSGNL